MTMKIAIATERHDLHRLAYVAIGAGNSQNVSDVERCCDVLRCLMRLNLPVKDLCHSQTILPLARLRDHENPKIRREAHVLFNSWMKTLYSSGGTSSTCDNAQISTVVKVCSALKKNEHQISPDITAAESSKNKTELLVSMKNEYKRSQTPETGEIKHIDDRKSFAAKLLHTKKHLGKLSENHKICPALKSVRDDDGRSIPTKSRRTQKMCDAVQVFPKLKMTDDQRLMKPADCKFIAPRSVQAKKQSTLPMKLSETPRYRPLQLKKKQLPVKVSENPPPLKKNSTEVLELFEVAKRSADIANAKGLLTANAETSICVDTLTLLMGYPISSTATETRRIMVKLEHLTKHKDRKICNSASTLLHHWRQSFRDQVHRESAKK